MNILKVTIAAAVLVMPLGFTASPVQAATAHNSQGGTSTTNDDTPTGRHMKPAKRMKHHKAM